MSARPTSSSSSSGLRLVGVYRFKVLFWSVAAASIFLYVFLTWKLAARHDAVSTDHRYYHATFPLPVKLGERPLVFSKEEFVAYSSRTKATTIQEKVDDEHKPTNTTVSTTIESLSPNVTSLPGGKAHSSEQSNEKQQHSDNKPFLHYDLYQDRPYNITFGPYTHCQLGISYNKRGKKPIERVALTDFLTNIMNVTTYINTNLKLLSVGDSVGMQFHQVLEEAVGGRWNDPRRTVYQNAWGDHESVSVLAGKGTVVAGFRMTGLLLQAGKDQPPPNAGPNLKSGAGGWKPEQVRQLLDHEYYSIGTATTTRIKIQQFDVMLFRIPHGWLTLDTITEQNLQEALLLANDLFGVHTVLIHTLFFNNNVRTVEELHHLHETNDMIRHFVQDWDHSNITVLLLDFGRWIDQLVEWNAKTMLHMDITTSNYTLQRLGCFKFPPSLAVACASLENRTDCTCLRNRLSIDGMHWCMESIGGRITAATACLIQCSLLPQSEHQTCQTKCNEDFMSMKSASSIVETYHSHG